MKNPIVGYIIGIVCAYIASEIMFDDPTISLLFLTVFLFVWGFIFMRSQVTADKAEREERDDN